MTSYDTEPLKGKKGRLLSLQMISSVSCLATPLGAEVQFGLLELSASLWYSGIPLKESSQALSLCFFLIVSNNIPFRLVFAICLLYSGM